MWEMSQCMCVCVRPASLPQYLPTNNMVGVSKISLFWRNSLNVAIKITLNDPALLKRQNYPCWRILAPGTWFMWAIVFCVLLLGEPVNESGRKCFSACWMFQVSTGNAAVTMSKKKTGICQLLVEELRAQHWPLMDAASLWWTPRALTILHTIIEMPWSFVNDVKWGNSLNPDHL